MTPHQTAQKLQSQHADTQSLHTTSHITNAPFVKSSKTWTQHKQFILTESTMFFFNNWNVTHFSFWQSYGKSPTPPSITQSLQMGLAKAWDYYKSVNFMVLWNVTPCRLVSVARVGREVHRTLESMLQTVATRFCATLVPYRQPTACVPQDRHLIHYAQLPCKWPE